MNEVYESILRRQLIEKTFIKVSQKQLSNPIRFGRDGDSDTSRDLQISVQLLLRFRCKSKANGKK